MTRTAAFACVAALAVGLAACVARAPAAQTDDQSQTEPQSQTKPEATEMQIESPAFEPGETIPREHTCEGEDIAPPLQWSQIPEGTKSLALIVDDPDAPDPKNPKRTWVHWVVYELPPTTEGLPRGGALPVGAREGNNDWGRTGYGGPCPPIGEHRYFFKLYALDKALGDLSEPSKAELEDAMTGHVLAKAELVGVYEKQG